MTLVFMFFFNEGSRFFFGKAAEVTQCGDLHIMTLFGEPEVVKKSNTYC